MVVANPQEYASKFRDELVADLELNPRLCCPKCIITYVDNWQEDCCYIDESGELNCVFDFENTHVEEAVREWIYAVLKMIRREKDETIVEKWRQRLQ